MNIRTEVTADLRMVQAAVTGGQGMKSKSKTIVSVLLLLSLLLGAFASGSIASAAEQEQQSGFVAPILVVNTSFLNVRTGPGAQYTALITVVGGTELPVLAVASDQVWYQVSTVAGVGWVNIEFTIPRGDFSRVPVVGIPSAGEVIAGGSTSSGSVTQPGSAPVAAPAPSSGGTSRVIINVEATNLQVSPSVDSGTVGTVFRDDTKLYRVVGATVDANGLQWFQIVVPEVGTGWVDAGKILFVASEDDGRTVIVITGDVIAMTDSPGGGNNGLPILTRGAEAYLLGFSRDTNFAQIQLIGNGPTGWVPTSAIEIRESLIPEDELVDSTSASVTAPGGVPAVPTPVQPGLEESRVVVNTAFLNIRSGPGVEFTSVATVSGGTELRVLGVASDGVWFLVEGSFGRGWLNIEFAIFRGNISTVPIIRETGSAGVLAQPVAVISGAVTLFAAPSPNFGTLGTLAGPVEVNIVARTADFAWVQLNTPLGFGWVPANQVAIRGDTSIIPIVG